MTDTGTIEMTDLMVDAPRETCTRCGMVANIDPFLHTKRYGHRPEVRRDGKTYRFSFYTAAFTQKVA